jgi:hypothetical protein
MEKTNKKNNKILIFIAALGLLLITIFFLGADTVSKNGGNNESAKLNAGDNIEKADKLYAIIYSFDEGDKESTVFSGLLNYGSRNNIEVKYNNDYDFGVFIESIGGIKNGDEGKYWQYYINDVLGDVAADKKNLNSGDVVEWRFEESPF